MEEGAAFGGVAFDFDFLAHGVRSFSIQVRSHASMVGTYCIFVRVLDGGGVVVALLDFREGGWSYDFMAWAG